MGPSYVVQNYPKVTEEDTHLIWATGGSMVPDEIKKAEYQKGLEYKINPDAK